MCKFLVHFGRIQCGAFLFVDTLLKILPAKEHKFPQSSVHTCTAFVMGSWTQKLRPGTNAHEGIQTPLTELQSIDWKLPSKSNGPFS